MNGNFERMKNARIKKRLLYKRRASLSWVGGHKPRVSLEVHFRVVSYAHNLHFCLSCILSVFFHAISFLHTTLLSTCFVLSQRRHGQPPIKKAVIFPGNNMPEVWTYEHRSTIVSPFTALSILIIFSILAYSAFVRMYSWRLWHTLSELLGSSSLKLTDPASILLSNSSYSLAVRLYAPVSGEIVSIV